METYIQNAVDIIFKSFFLIKIWNFYATVATSKFLKGEECSAALMEHFSNSEKRVKRGATVRQN